METGHAKNVGEAVVFGNKMLEKDYIIKIYGGRKTFENSRGFYQANPHHPEAPTSAAPSPPPTRESPIIRRATTTDSVATEEPQPEDQKAEGVPTTPKEAFQNQYDADPSPSPPRKAITPPVEAKKSWISPSYSEEEAGLSFNHIRERIQGVEKTVYGLEAAIKQSRNSIRDLLARQDELRLQHATLMKATASLQQTLLKLVTLCLVIFLTVNVLPEILGGQLAAVVGWICTILAGVVTIILGGGFKSWISSFYTNREGTSPEMPKTSTQKTTLNGNHTPFERMAETSQAEMKSKKLEKPAVSGRVGERGVLYLDTFNKGT